MKKHAFALFALLAMFRSEGGLGQDVNFNILPLAINPAFTGMFEGRLRASGLYKHQWSPRTSFNAYGPSLDSKLGTNQTSYLAVGGAFLENGTTDGSLDNFSGVASVAWHKTYLPADQQTSKPITRLSFGVQAGYIARNINLTGIENSIQPRVFHIGGGAKYIILNAGLSFFQAYGQRFAYTIGLSGNNLNLMNDGTITELNPLLRVTPSATGIAMLQWVLNDRFAVRPAALYLTNKNFYLAGNEFRFSTSRTNPANVAFLDIWYRKGNVLTFTPGFEFKAYRLAVGYDYFYKDSGKGGLQVVGRYIMPGQK